MPRVKELWVYPIKSCQGVLVEDAELALTGFKLDRQWCVVDLHGTRYPEREFLSQRKCPKLATIGVKITSSSLLLSAPGMDPLEVPLDEKPYLANPKVSVTCGGKSTTDPNSSSWSLGEMEGRSAGAKAEEWFSKYLNDVDIEKARFPKATYTLVRCLSSDTRSVADYAGPTATWDKPLRGSDLSRVNARKGDGVAFHDFAPFLLTSQDSVDELTRAIGMPEKSYPVTPFRGSIVVEGTQGPWDEEEWLEFSIGNIRFRKLKECPRCSIPCRDQETGEFIFKDRFFGGGGRKELLQATKTLGQMFPAKRDDPEWGIWKGAFFGVYVGHDDQKGTIKTGMEVTVHSRRAKAFDWSRVACLFVTAGALSASAIALLRRSRQ